MDNWLPIFSFALSLIGGMLGSTWSASRRVANWDRDIKELREKLSEMKTGLDSHKEDFTEQAAVLEERIDELMIFQAVLKDRESRGLRSKTAKKEPHGMPS